VLLLTDPLRPDAPRMTRALRQAGIDRMVLVTGDRADISLMSANANTAARSESHNVVAR
jgi:cation transport ATPase